MTAAQDLWASVVASYESTGLIALTALRDPSAEAIDTAVGESAAQAVIDLWPAYAQVDFDATNALHMEAGRQATIAMLWKRGGTAQNIAKVEWDDVWGDDGPVGRIRKVGARGRQGPGSTSGVSTQAENRNGQVLGWSDPDALPLGLLPLRRGAY